MRTAVVRVLIDGDGVLAADRYAAGLSELAARGFDVVASPAEHLPERGREVELIVEGLDRDDVEAVGGHVAACSAAFGLPARAGVVTYISRGTDADAEGVLAAFGVAGKVVRHLGSADGSDEVVSVTLTRADLRRVPESRLHTALEAALNCEVRIVAEG
jgi:hypothetical protein